MRMIRDIQVNIKVYKKRDTFILWGNRNGIPRNSKLSAHEVKVNNRLLDEEDYDIQLRRDGTITIKTKFFIEPLRKEMTLTVFGKTFTLRKAKESVFTTTIVVDQTIVDHNQVMQQVMKETNNGGRNGKGNRIQ